MGAPEGESPLDGDEQPQMQVILGRAFWLGKCEVTNQQYARLDPHHDTGWMDTHGKDRVGPGVPINGPLQPVTRVSCLDAERFCRWLSDKTAVSCRLPTEAEWEHACRAGTQTPFWCAENELAQCANTADASLGQLKPWALRDNSRSDGAVCSANVGSYRPNPWGLMDMHGNVFEWTASSYRPYPYDAADGREQPRAEEERVVRGGSWDDMPRRCRSAFRLSYDPTQPVYNVGFRVLVEE
jgi:formylglycine-generating enzyme required for sulfatase activity